MRAFRRSSKREQPLEYRGGFQYLFLSDEELKNNSFFKEGEKQAGYRLKLLKAGEVRYRHPDELRQIITAVLRKVREALAACFVKQPCGANSKIR